jgi:hypothetical protein
LATRIAQPEIGKGSSAEQTARRITMSVLLKNKAFFFIPVALSILIVIGILTS